MDCKEAVLRAVDKLLPADELNGLATPVLSV